MTGLYCMHVPDAAEHFEGETGRAVKRLMKGLTDGVAEGIFDQTLSHFGKGQVPPPKVMVQRIVLNGGPPGVSALYDNYYVPLSSLYLHGGPVGLMRHVRPRTDQTRDRPFRLWSRRSAVHTADAMVGLLGAAIAGPDHEAYEKLASYEAAHWGVTWTPLFFISRGVAVTRVRVRYLPSMVSLVRRLRAQVARGEKLSDADADAVIEALTQVAGADGNEPAFVAISRAIRERLLAGEDGLA